MIEAGVGYAEGLEDSHAAGVNACQQAVDQLGKDPNIVFVFSSALYDQEQMLAGIRSVSKDATLIGASTAGEITTMGPCMNNSVAVMALAADGVTHAAANQQGLSTGAYDAGRQLAETLKTQLGTDPQLFLMMADGLSASGSEVVRGVLSVLESTNASLAGGSAGDDAQYKKTFQYFGENVYSDSVGGLALSGAFKHAVGVKHGWRAVGLPKTITKSEGAVLHEIDGKPAIELFKEYLGDDIVEKLENQTLAEVALSYPIGIKEKTSEEWILRAPFFVDENGSITCGGEVPEGSTVRLMIGNKEAAMQAAQEAAQEAMDSLGTAPKAAIIFNCHVRDKMYQQREASAEEIKVIQSVIGQDTPLLGFYTYAEQAPMGGSIKSVGGCNAEVHNETVVIVLLGDE